MLGGELGESLGPELGELVGRAGRLGETLLQRGDLVLEAADLSVARIRLVTGLPESLKASLELGAKVGVGACAVEGGAVDALFSRSWLYNQPDLRAEVERLRARGTPPSPLRSVPDQQRASDTSLLRRLESATERIRRLEEENVQLRESLALALGERRAADVLGNTHDTPRNKSAAIIDPC
jgi:hypothetical protein